MNTIIHFLKSERCGHALGVILILTVFLISYGLVGTIEFNSLTH